MKKSLFAVIALLLLGAWRATASEPIINPEIQAIAEAELATAITANKADWGTAIVMNVKSGQIVAMANLKSDGKGNCAVGDDYALHALEPGGLFKPVSMMVAMRKGWAYPLEKQITIGKSYTPGEGMPIHDTHSPSALPISRLLEYSSNIGIAKLMEHHYSNSVGLLVDLDSLGLFADLGLKDERMPVVGIHTDKSGIARQAFGYGPTISPIRMCAIYNSAARGDILTPEQTADWLAMLHTVVYGEGGTAKALRDDTVDIAGMTGTAYVYDNKKQEYTEAQRHAFCGIFPYDSPQYTCLVVISNPKEKGGSARTAGAATLSIAKRLASPSK